MILSLIKLALLTIALPVLFGLGLASAFRQPLKSPAVVFASGTLVQWGTFCLLVLAMTRLSGSSRLSSLSRAETVLLILLSAASVVFCILWLRPSKKELRTFLTPRPAYLIALLVVALSLLFVLPHVEDVTPERVSVIIDSALFSEETVVSFPEAPVSYIPADEPAVSAMYLFYAILSFWTGLGPVTLVHWGIGFVFLLVFFAFYAWMARLLFVSEGMNTLRRIFLWTAAGFFGAQLLVDGLMPLSVFSNVWNGLTLGWCFILPLSAVLSVSLFAPGTDESVLTFERSFLAVCLLCCLPAAAGTVIGGIQTALIIAVICGLSGGIRCFLSKRGARRVM